jgi:hypothetical protein
VAIGYCRLFGVEEHDIGGALTDRFAIASAHKLIAMLSKWTANADQLGIEWEQAPNPREADKTAARRLKDRTEAWAALESIHLSFAEMVNNESPLTSSLGDTIDSLAGLLNRFDSALERHVDILSTLCGSPLIDGWEQRLGGEYRDPPPWWVGESLRIVATRARNRAVPAKPCAPPMLPDVVPTAGLAAGPTEVVLPGPKWAWIRPDGAFRATLRLPAPLTADELQTPRALTFRDPDGAPVASLTNEPIRLGAISGLRIGDDGRVLVSLADLSPGSPVQLWVGSPEQEWTPVPEVADGEADHG